MSGPGPDCTAVFFRAGGDIQQPQIMTMTMSVASVQGPALLIALWSFALYDGDTSHRQQLPIKTVPGVSDQDWVLWITLWSFALQDGDISSQQQRGQHGHT